MHQAQAVQLAIFARVREGDHSSVVHRALMLHIETRCCRKLDYQGTICPICISSVTGLGLSSEQGVASDSDGNSSNAVGGSTMPARLLRSRILAESHVRSISETHHIGSQMQQMRLASPLTEFRSLRMHKAKFDGCVWR